MPPRRRREGVAVQARTREPSLARVRVPARQKAPWSFRRCHPSRGGIRGGPRPDRRATKSSRLHRESSRRPGCPRHHEKGTRDIVQERAARLCSSASARNLLRPREWNTARVSRRVQVAVRRPPMRQRMGGPTQPASVGAGEQRGESPTRVRRSNARWVCSRVVSRLQKSASEAWVQRSVSPVGSGARGRGPNPRRFERAGEGERGGENRGRGGQATNPGKSGAGRSRGRRGAKVLARWKASRIARRPASFTRTGWRRSRRLSSVDIPCERMCTGERGDRDVRGPVRTHCDGNKNAHRDDAAKHVRPTEANRTDVTQAMSPTARSAQALRRDGNPRGAGTRTKK